MKSLLSSLKVLKDKFVASFTGVEFALAYASGILFVWAYSLILSVMFPDLSLFNLIVQGVLVPVFAVLVVKQYFKDAKWLPKTQESFKPTFPTPAIVHVPVILPPPMTTKVVADVKKKAPRKPRRTKAEMATEKKLKEAKLARAKKEVN